MSEVVAMKREDKIKRTKKWYREGRIKKLGSSCFSVPSEAFVLGITPRLVSEVLKK